MNKYKIKMTHTVELFVEAENEESVQDWMNTHTPEEVERYGVNEYEDEIVCEVRDDSVVDLIIE